MDRWPLAGAVCAFLIGGACAPGVAAEPPTQAMERAQREADGPKRRILEAAKAGAKATAKADATPARTKVVAEAASAAGTSKPAVIASATPPLTVGAAAPKVQTVDNVNAILPAATAAAASQAPDALRPPTPPDMIPSPGASVAPPQQPVSPLSALSPLSAPPPVPAQRSAPEEAYAADLNRLVDGLKRYPTSREARTLRPQGTVKIWLEVDRSGQLLEVGLAESSGAPLLDGEALRSVRVGRFAAFPAGAFDGQASRRFVVAIEYRHDGG